MKKLLVCFVIGLMAFVSAQAQNYQALGNKLEEYFTALAGEDASVQQKECDYLIESCQDSLVRQYVTLKIYDHYLRSKIMGDDAVAVHVADKWLLSGKVKMDSAEDLANVDIYATFNRKSLIGRQAPSLSLFTESGSKVNVPAAGQYSVIYFYSPDCPTCKMETAALSKLAQSGEFPIKIFAVNVGDKEADWATARESFPEAIHVWDPSMESDWQMSYGVLKTPWMFLVNSAGVIIGRGLDTPSLKMLLAREFASGNYNYGEDSQMERYKQMFAAYSDRLKVSDVLDVADYLAVRTFGEGDIDAFKQVEGDLLYFLASQREETYKDAIAPFVEKYLNIPDVWTTPGDTSQVLNLGKFLCELTARTPVGSQVPDIKVDGTLRRKKCLFRSGSKEGTFSLKKLRGNPAYVVFYTGGCASCAETLEQVTALIASKPRTKVLLVDMDQIMSSNPNKCYELLETFDLTAMPFVIELDRKGTIMHKYVDLTKEL